MALFNSLHNPKLPNLSNAKTLNLNLSGNQVKLAAPPFSARVGWQPEHNTKFNIYDPSEYIVNERTPKLNPSISCYSTAWGVFGAPIIQGCIGEIRFNISVSKYSPKESILNHLELESLEAEQLDWLCGPKSKFNQGSIKARVNWSPYKNNDLIWINYLIKKLECENSQKEYSDIWLLPLTSEHALMVSFACTEFHPKSDLYNHYKRFTNEIIKTIEVSFSNDTKDQQEESKKIWPNQKYTKNLPSLEWLEPEEEA